MSNTITFTFDGTLPQIGQTIVLTQINSFNVTEDLTYNYVSQSTIEIPFTIRIVSGVPQANFNANQLRKTLIDTLNPSLYSVVQVDNVVTVTSLTQDFSFESGTSNFTGVTISVDFNPIFSGIQRINIRSPFFVSAPVFDGNGIVSSILTTFNIYIYEGELDTDKPSTPNYVYQKKPRFLNDNNIYIDISKQISDFIDNKYTEDLETQCVFVEIDIVNDYDGGQLTDNKKYLALNGFNLHSENVNHLPKKDLLINNRVISVLEGENIKLPFYLGGDDYKIQLFYFDRLLKANFNIDSLEVLQTNEIVEYLFFSYKSIDEVTETLEPANNLKITNLNTGEIEFIGLEIVTECIYDPVKITFVNRQGVLQEFNTYKVSKETIKATNDDYSLSVLDEGIDSGIPTLSYDPTKHNKKVYNKQATKSIELNTGYIQEDNNILIEEMLESEYIWLTLDGVVIPVNLSTKSVPLLTKINDQLIKYKLNFDFSYNEIQKIR